MKSLVIQKSTLVAIVLDEHFDRLSIYRWYIRKGIIYRSTYHKNRHRKNGQLATKNISLANEVMQTEGKLYDHKDRNFLNNIPDNLRLCDTSKNNTNKQKKTGFSSKYKGVHWSKLNNKWRAYINKNGKTIYLGFFLLEEDAARAYDKAALEIYGEFAVLNFPKSEVKLAEELY